MWQFVAVHELYPDRSFLATEILGIREEFLRSDGDFLDDERVPKDNMADPRLSRVSRCGNALSAPSVPAAGARPAGQDQRDRSLSVGRQMGNRLLTETIDHIDAQGRTSTSPRLHYIVMAAPDVYVRLFQQAADAFRRHAQRVTIYASEHDAALACSKFMHSNPRLGQAGPALFVARGFDTIDASATEPPSWLPAFPCTRGHSYMIRNHRIQADMQSLVRSNLPPDERHGLTPKELNGLQYWAFRELAR